MTSRPWKRFEDRTSSNDKETLGWSSLLRVCLSLLKFILLMPQKTLKFVDNVYCLLQSYLFSVTFDSGILWPHTSFLNYQLQRWFVSLFLLFQLPTLHFFLKEALIGGTFRNGSFKELLLDFFLDIFWFVCRIPSQSSSFLWEFHSILCIMHAFQTVLKNQPVYLDGS